METRKFTQSKPAKNGRIAILARKNTESPWVQVESILGDDVAQSFMEQLEYDEDKRAEYIDYAEAEEEDWGDDALADA